MADIIVGVDLGGTSIKFGVGNHQGELFQTDSIPTEAYRGPESVMSRIVESTQKMLDELGLSLSALGIGAPGLIDVSSGTTRFLPNLPTQWVDIPLGETLSSKLGCPVMVANDARTATLGELKFGYGRLRKNLSLAFFTLGTGVGGGVAIDGKLRLGEFGSAGELGHQTIDPQGLRCGCGNYGCLETLASGPAITAAAVRLMRSGQAPSLHEYCEGDAQKVSIESLVHVMHREDSVLEVIERAARAIGIASANVVTTIHPDLIVLGGGVAEIGDFLIDTVKDEMVKRVRMFSAENVEVKKSALGVKAGLLGAIGLGVLALENESLEREAPNFEES